MNYVFYDFETSGNNKDFAVIAKVEAKKLQQEMAMVLSEAGI